MPKTHQYKFKAEKIRNSRLTCSTASAPTRSTTPLRTRRRSTASSVAGESMAVTNEARKVRNASGSRAKPHSTKLNLRNPKKGSQAGKSLRPTTGILQNAIVLAPFHTLKRCFQNKLVDLYSYEKMKKINRKIKMAEKQKMSFEYDIVELNRLGPNIKKEGKGSKVQQKLRSPSYCRCDRNNKPDSKKPPNTVRKAREPNRIMPQVSNFLGHLETKRRKLNTPPLTPNVLKAELSPRLDFCSPNTSFPSDTNLTSSRLSSRSKSDSSETYSNAPYCRDERLTGSLAISATSFDSCLEQFDRPDCDRPPTTTTTTTKRTKTRRSTEILHSPNCLPKPNANSSRHLIMHNGTKNSDGCIVDFLDREPQSQVIASVESTHHLQPLSRRLSKTRPATGKKTESANVAGYYLRSLTPCRDDLPAEPRPSPERPLKRILQIEVGTQVERISPGREESEVKDSVNVLQRDVTAEPPSEEKPDSEEPLAECDFPKAELAPVVGPVETQLKDVEGGPGQDFPEESATMNAFELVSDLEERFQESSGLERAQDEESSFIFGPRNTASRLGESCKFSFGLNFVFSDDED